MRTDQDRLRDMIQSLSRLMGYRPASRAAFDSDFKTQDAILFQLIILGEAANQLSDSARSAAVDIPLREATDLRNVIVHRYWDVDQDRIWHIIETDVPRLHARIAALLQATA